MRDYFNPCADPCSQICRDYDAGYASANCPQQQPPPFGQTVPAPIIDPRNPPKFPYTPGAVSIPGTNRGPLTPPPGLPPGTPGTPGAPLPGPRPNGQAPNGNGQAATAPIPTWVYVAGGAGVLGLGYLLLRSRRR